MWLFLWVVFVLTAAGFFLWSYHAIYEQKRTWKKFAQKHNLEYMNAPLMQSPSMAGDLKGRQVNFYTQIVDTPQGQKLSKNVIEVFLNEIPDLLCVAASSGFSDFVSMLDLPDPFSVDDEKWPQNLMARTFENEVPEIWFKDNKNRVEAIYKLSKLPFDTLFLSDGEQAFVAIRTSNPLSNPAQLNKVIGVLYETVKLLEEKSSKPEDKSTDEIETDTDSD